MNGKGDKWRGGWTTGYADNFNKIFGDKMRVTPKQYLDMWLSEQIPTDEWLRILNEKKDVKKLYNKHLENSNGKTNK
tara:strand:+ start:818 stop:1048 length:231 start_codon:yes stop_codon:yes gene_type:complete